MDKTVLNVKTDKALKIKAQKVAKDIGLPLGTIVNHYLREFVKEKRVVFSLYPELRPEKKKLYAEIWKDIVKGNNLAGPFKNVKEAISYLRS